MDKVIFLFAYCKIFLSCHHSSVGRAIDGLSQLNLVSDGSWVRVPLVAYCFQTALVSSFNSLLILSKILSIYSPQLFKKLLLTSL
jgi:hypothetical protein